MNFFLADELSKRGWETTIVTLFKRDTYLWPEDTNGATQVNLNASTTSDKIKLIPKLLKLAQNCDVILAGVEGAPTNYGHIISSIARKPFVSWTHNAFKEFIKDIGRVDALISKLIYKRTKHIVFPSEGSRASLENVIGPPPPGHNRIVIDNFTLNSNQDHLDSTLDISIFNKPVVIGIGRLEPQKAWHRLIQCHASIIKAGISHNLVILGEGSTRLSLENLADDLHVKNSTFLPGQTKDIYNWLKRSTVFALCSKYEGLPLVLIEALSAGVPIVAMDCHSGPKEILCDGKFGYLTPPDNLDSFASAISDLLQSEKLRKDFSRRGKERAKHYLPENIIPEWECYLNSIKQKHNN